MIHILLILDRNKSIGIELYNNEFIKFQPDLLIGLVQALMLLSEEMGEAKGPLREAELGNYQISILSKDHIAYIVVQDAIDSEPFTRRILDSIVEKHHQEFMEINFTKKIINEEGIRKSIAELLKTMKFPIMALPDIEPFVDDFNKNTNNICDVLMMADLDDGIIRIWNRPENDSIIKVLMELLSEIDYQRSWFGESTLYQTREIETPTGRRIINRETWFMYRIGETDFCIMGRAYYSPGIEKDIIIKNLENLSGNIFKTIMDFGINDNS